MKIEDITLDWLMARVIERDGCLIWNGGYGGKNIDHPQIFVNGSHESARRVMWELTNDRKMPKGHRAKSTCTEKGCIHPDHITKAKHGSELIGVNTGMIHRIGVAMTKRKVSRFSDETIARIRQGEITHKQAIEDHGMSHKYFYDIRNGIVRRDYSSPFAGLGA